MTRPRSGLPPPSEIAWVPPRDRAHEVDLRAVRHGGGRDPAAGVPIADDRVDVLPETSILIVLSAQLNMEEGKRERWLEHQFP